MDDDAEADAEWRRRVLEAWEELQVAPWAVNLWWLRWFDW